MAWSDMFTMVGKELGVEVTAYTKWVDLLEDTLQQPALRDNTKALSPALRLLDFYRDRRSLLAGAQADMSKSDAYDGLLFPRIDMKEMLRVAPSLANGQPLNIHHVRSWLQFWESHAV